MSTREITGHLRELYGIDASPDLISTITDAVLEELAPWLTVVADRDGREHAVLSDGWRHIRLDVEAGTLAHGGRVLLLYRIAGLASARARLLPLRRFLDLAEHPRFPATLFPRARTETPTSELPSLMRNSVSGFHLKKK